MTLELALRLIIPLAVGVLALALIASIVWDIAYRKGWYDGCYHAGEVARYERSKERGKFQPTTDRYGDKPTQA